MVKDYPPPEDYLNTDYWNKTVPFGKNSSWKPFCTRKNCVRGVAPPSINETDNKLCIGYNKDLALGTTEDESPSTIIWNGRQLLSLGAAAQQTTFFNPSRNYHIDTYNSFPTVNDTDIKSWENVKYVEVSSQWGPFPDGVYYDWAPGTGVWLELGKHKVGYNGLDLIRRLGNEFVEKNIDLIPLYQEMWNKTGLFTMKIDKNDKLSLPFVNVSNAMGSFGLYGSVIMTKSQISDINGIIPYFEGTNTPKFSWFSYDSADGELFNNIAKIIKSEYYVNKNGKWFWTDIFPNNNSYVKNYPLPLPFYSNHLGNQDGSIKINPLALKLPWSYQLFNIANIARRFVIDLLFINADAIDNSKPLGLEYVDWIKLSVKNPLKKPNSWGQALDKLNELLSKGTAHPVFLRYARIGSEKNMADDGPYIILKYYLSLNLSLNLSNIQKAPLDKNIFIQTVSKNKNGVTYASAGNLIQSSSANLEIDHWFPILGKPLNYDSCIRIQHWCGNKSLALDIEIINISQRISGSLVSNMSTTNLYDTWKKQSETRLYIRDPFESDSHVYQNDGEISIIRNKYKNKKGRNIILIILGVIFIVLSIGIILFILKSKKVNKFFIATICVSGVLGLSLLLIGSILYKKSDSKNILWGSPPWIAFFPNNTPEKVSTKNFTGNYSANIFGWPGENLEVFWASNRLTFCPCNSLQIALSGAYPEYNEKLFDYFVKNPNLLKF